MKARKFVIKGTCFKIGCGFRINPWTDPWVPGIEGFIPKIREGTDMTRWRRVVDFKSMTTNDWNVDFIHELFEPKSEMAILALQWPDTVC